MDGVTADWRSDAACAEVGPAPFFSEKGGKNRAARRICQGCSVRDACLSDALAHGDRYGIRAGLSARERRQLAAGSGEAPRGPDWAAVDAVLSGRLRATQVHQVDRDEAVRRLTGQGLSGAEIATRIGVAKRTVVRRRRRLGEAA